MAHDSSSENVEKQPGPAIAAAGDTKPRDGIDSGAMAGNQSRAWQELRGEEADDVEKKATRSTNASASNSVAAVKRSSGDAIAIEMETVTPGQSHAPLGCASGSGVAEATGAGLGSDGAAAEAAAGVQYKVYKRRWFGLVQLTLLNIIVSWDVSSLFFSLVFRLFEVVGSGWSAVVVGFWSTPRLSAAPEVRGIRTASVGGSTVLFQRHGWAWETCFQWGLKGVALVKFGTDGRGWIGLAQGTVQADGADPASPRCSQPHPSQIPTIETCMKPTHLGIQLLT